MRVLLSCLAILVTLAGGPASAAPDAADTARIEQAYGAKQDAARRADIDSRIAARWTQLGQDPGAPTIGSANADVTIVEFSDYACPYCKAMEPRLEALLNADHRVKLVMMEFPILTPQSLVGTRAALAAMQQGKYRQFHQALMRFEGQLAEADIFDTAKASGLDVARLRRDMQAPQIADRIIANFNLARGIRVVQTPAIIVSGPAGTHIMGSDSAGIDFPKAVAAARGK